MVAYFYKLRTGLEVNPGFVQSQGNSNPLRPKAEVDSSYQGTVQNLDVTDSYSM